VFKKSRWNASYILGTVFSSPGNDGAFEAPDRSGLWKRPIDKP
jgi:hypothetical protein